MCVRRCLFVVNLRASADGRSGRVRASWWRPSCACAAAATRDIPSWILPGRARRLPHWRDTESVLRLSRGRRGVLIRLTFCESHGVMTTLWFSEQGATSNCPTVARVQPLERGRTKTVPLLLLDSQTPSVEGMLVRVWKDRSRPHGLKAGLASLGVTGVFLPRAVSGPPH